MLRVVDDTRPGALSYMAVRSDRNLVVEDPEPAELGHQEEMQTEPFRCLFGVACSIVAGAVCGAMMALML